MSDDVHLVYATARRIVAAFDAYSGEEVWRAKLPGGYLFASGITSLTVEGEVVIAGINGTLTAFDRWTGTILWSRAVKGFGKETVMFAGSTAGTAQQIAAQQAEAASSG